MPNFMKIHPEELSCSTWTDKTDMTQPTVAFHNFENASKNSKAKLELTEQFWLFIYLRGE